MQMAVWVSSAVLFGAALGVHMDMARNGRGASQGWALAVQASVLFGSMAALIVPLSLWWIAGLGRIGIGWACLALLVASASARLAASPVAWQLAFVAWPAAIILLWLGR